MPSKQRLSPRSRKEQAIQLSWAASKLHLLATLAVASEWSPSETRGQNWIQRQFRGETKPTKHRFKPSEQIRHTSWQLRLAKLQVFTCQKLCAFITWYGVRNEIYEILETHVNLFDFTCVTCKKVRVMLGGSKAVFRGLFHPEIASWTINWLIGVHLVLGAVLAPHQFAIAADHCWQVFGYPVSSEKGLSQEPSMEKLLSTLFITNHDCSSTTTHR